MRQDAKDAIKAAVTVPQHIQHISAAVVMDLLFGPTWCARPETWEQFDPDSVTSDPSETENAISVYGEPADVLRTFIDELPTLYLVGEDGDAVSDTQPEGYFDEDPEEDGGEREWIEAEPFSELSRRDIVAALFGDTLAREFN